MPGAGGQIYAYDPSGHLRPGWPIQAPNGAGYEADSGYALAPDGGLLVATPTAITDIELTGEVHPGWPVSLPEGSGQILVQPSGTIVIVQVAPATSEAWVYALTLAGDKPERWSTRVPGNFSVGATLAAPDGTLFISGTDSAQRGSMVTLGSDGKQIASWSMGSWSAMAVTPASNLVVKAYDTKATTSGMLEYNVLRTHVSLLDRNGKTLPGWPHLIDGPASAPAVGPDGFLYFVLGNTVATGSVLALDSSGNAEAGWPVKLPSGYAGVPGDQSAGHTNVSEPPIVANGLIYVAASTATGGQMIAAFKTSRGDHAGWVYQVPSDSRFTGSTYVPAVAAPVGTLYVLEQTAPSSGAVVALGREGSLLPGWPYDFSPGPLSLTVLADGGVGVSSMDFATRLTTSGSPPG